MNIQWICSNAIGLKFFSSRKAGAPEPTMSFFWVSRHILISRSETPVPGGWREDLRKFGPPRFGTIHAVSSEISFVLFCFGNKSTVWLTLLHHYYFAVFLKTVGTWLVELRSGPSFASCLQTSRVQVYIYIIDPSCPWRPAHHPLR